MLAGIAVARPPGASPPAARARASRRASANSTPSASPPPRARAAGVPARRARARLPLGASSSDDAPIERADAYSDPRSAVDPGGSSRSSDAFGAFAPAVVRSLQTRTLVAMFLSYLSVYFVRKPFSVVKAPMQDALGLSTASIAGVDSAFLGLYAVGQLVLPGLGDRLGAKKMLVSGYLLAAAACVVFAFTSNPLFLAAAWGLNGAAQSLAYPLHVKLLNPWFAPNQRGTAMGVWATSQQVGGVLSTAAAAFLLGAVGWRLAVVLPAVSVVLSAAMLCFVRVDPPWCKLEAKKSDDVAVVGECDWSAPVSTRETLAIPKLKMLMASYFFVKIVRYCLIFWLPYYLARECGFGVAAAGYMACLFDAGGVVGGIVTGVVCDKYFPGRRPVLGAYMCAALAVAVLCYQSASRLGVVANGVVMGVIGLLVAGPDALLGSSSIADTCEAAGYGSEVLGAASGLVNGAGSVGAVLQGALTAYVADRYGWGALFGALAAACACGTACMLMSVPKQSKASLKVATS